MSQLTRETINLDLKSIGFKRMINTNALIVQNHIAANFIKLYFAIVKSAYKCRY